MSNSIDKLDRWELDVVSKYSSNHRDNVSHPESTLSNMLTYFEKINELVKEVNTLKEQIKQMKS